MAKNTNIDFTLLGLTTKQFATIEDNYSDDGNIRFGVSFNFGINQEDNVITVLSAFQFECNENIFMMVEAGGHFRIEEKAYADMLSENASRLIVPKGFIQHLAMLAVGTTRGILHTKTENTKFNNFFIPPVNVSDFIKKDVEFDLSNNTEEPS